MAKWVRYGYQDNKLATITNIHMVDHAWRIDLYSTDESLYAPVEGHAISKGAVIDTTQDYVAVSAQYFNSVFTNGMKVLAEDKISPITIRFFIPSKSGSGFTLHKTWYCRSYKQINRGLRLRDYCYELECYSFAIDMDWVEATNRSMLKDTIATYIIAHDVDANAHDDINSRFESSYHELVHRVEDIHSKVETDKTTSEMEKLKLIRKIYDMDETITTMKNKELVLEARLDEWSKLLHGSFWQRLKVLLFGLDK